MSRSAKRLTPLPEDQPMFAVPPAKKVRRRHGAQEPVWTDNKARLIQVYLRLFVFITKHGTYIDGFAGPQQTDRTGSWSAQLALENEPKWMRHFYLCDCEQAKVATLHDLKANHPGRGVEIFEGDFNIEIDRMLPLVKAKEASFCLLDQRTFECHWATVKKIASHKPQGENKIELFYFFFNGWFERTMAALGEKGQEEAAAWWGRDDWQSLIPMKSFQRAELVRDRFEAELGYEFVAPYAIYSRPARGGRIMYFMIHASDHPEAPTLMDRAYRIATLPTVPVEQLAMEFGVESSELSPRASRNR